MDSNSVNAINSYNINVTLIGELDHPDEKKEYINGSYRDDFETKRFKVDGNLRVFTIDKLLPFSLYNVTMESINTLGKSLPTYTLRVLTLSKTEAKLKAANPDPLPLPPKVPELPDTKACCRKNNVTHARYVCLSKLAQYHETLKSNLVSFSAVWITFVIPWHSKTSKLQT